MSLACKYFERLKLDQTRLDATPSLNKLQIFQEAHLAQIPFENTSQHGVGPSLSLDIPALCHKILDQKRGGFCFEQNGLAGHFLESIGYRVIRVPAWVEGCSAEESCSSCFTHMTLIVEAEDKKRHLVEVGFGEPPIHPLRYDSWGEEQLTPDGMRSKICKGEDETTASLYWYKDGEWKRRFSWEIASTIMHKGPDLVHFETGLKRVLEADSIFSQKLIVCKLNREEKITLAGNRLKRTGPPRFSTADPVYQTIESNNAAREVLRDVFGIPLEASEGLDLTKSLLADPGMWSHA